MSVVIKNTIARQKGGTSTASKGTSHGMALYIKVDIFCLPCFIVVVKEKPLLILAFTLAASVHIASETPTSIPLTPSTNKQKKYCHYNIEQASYVDTISNVFR